MEIDLIKKNENRIAKSKKERRLWAKGERKKLNFKELSERLVQKLQQTDEYKQAKNIMIFYPLEFEIDLLNLLEDKTKNFYLPKIDDKNLLCCSYKNGDILCESCFKTKEPISEATDKSILDLVVVPALAVDKNNYRLGYGGGFYDRFLCNFLGKTIVCISSKFIVDTVYPEEHDIKIDRVITI